MIQYILRRLLVLPLIMLLVSLILFFLLFQLPIEQRVEAYLPPVKKVLTEEQAAELIQHVSERYGLDKPFPVQYAAWMRNLFEGDWGYSPSWRQPVLEGLLQRVPASLELALAALFPAVALALVFGGEAARRYGRSPDHAIQSAAFVGWALPPFVLGLLLLNVFYAWLRWFPPEQLSQWAKTVVDGSKSGFIQYTGLHTLDALLNRRFDVFLDALRHLFLPALTLAVVQWAMLTRIMRASLLDALRQDYITTARAKGATEKRIVNLHARRNALIPVISTGGILASMLISGMVVVETVFNLNGLGRAAVKAILVAEVPTVVGFTLFACLVTVLSSLMADVLCAAVDPRTRLY